MTTEHAALNNSHATLTKRQTELQEEHVVLKAEHIVLMETHGTLKAEHEILQEENEVFHKQVSSLSVVVNMLEKDNKRLRSKVDNLTGRYEELHETLDPLVEVLRKAYAKEEGTELE